MREPVPTVPRADRTGRMLCRAPKRESRPRCRSDVTSPARLTWLNGEPSFFRVTMMGNASPHVALEVQAANP